MSNWFVVPCLDEGRDQMNKRFPKRSKASDGSIGDTAHQGSPSSHNPDESGNPEWDDHDGKNEVRARDFDSHLNDPDVSMEDVVQMWVKKARSGEMWWVRYIIFNGRIWHKRDGFTTRKYNGSDQHTGHVHVTTDFNEHADTVTGTNWHLADLKKGSAGSVPSRPEPLDVDGELGPKTISRWQQIMGTPVDGFISDHNSELVTAVQRRLRATVNSRLAVDGDLGPQTIVALQKYLGSPTDGVISKPKSLVVMALQRRLNQGKF